MEPAEADRVVRLCEQYEPGYGLYVVEKSETEFAPELAQRHDAAANYVRTGGRFSRSEPARVLALRTNYLRETYLYGDEVRLPGIEAFARLPALLDAARELHQRPVIEPAIVYANILLPGQELAVHTDVPEFRGANRKILPQWLLVVMHHSGLFDRWRMPIATGIAYFAPDGGHAEGGTLCYWPDGPDGAVRTFAARHNSAVVLDTDSVYHGVDTVGPPDVEPPEVEPGDLLRFVDGHWVLDRSGRTIAVYDWSDVRFSVSWKAYCFADEAERETWRTHTDDLSMAFILDTLLDDLRQRGVLGQTERPADRDLALLLIDTYERYPAPNPA
jgi:hypothetical protein